MKYYAIKHTSTGKFLPFIGRGATWVEPSSGQPPRLFTRMQDAKCALTHWLAGGISVARSYDGDENWSVIPQEHRIAEDMKIVPVIVEEIKEC